MGLEFLNLEQHTPHKLLVHSICSLTLSLVLRLSHSALHTGTGHCRNTVHSHLEGTGDSETESVTHIPHVPRHF